MVTLSERPNALALDFLYNLGDDDLIKVIYTEEHLQEEEAEFGTRGISKQKQKQAVSTIYNYIENSVANEFQMPVKYTQRKGVYRMQGNYPSIQHLKSSIRSVLFRDNTFDIDQCSSHPTILLYLMKKYCPESNFKCLAKYVKDRKQYIAEVIAKGVKPKIAKMLFLKSINKQERLKKRDKHTPFLDAFDLEMKKIQVDLASLEQTTSFHVPGGTTNAIGKFMSNILQHYEHKVNSVMIKVLEANLFEVCAYMHDGALVYENADAKLSKDELLSTIKREVDTALPGLEMNWSYKEHSQEIIIPDDYEAIGMLGGYANCKLKWEKLGYCKITQDVCFMQVLQDGTTLKYTRSDIKSIGEDFGCKDFIDTWLEDGDKAKYRTIGQYPPDRPCPPDVYNTWIPFAAESMEQVENIEGRNVLLKHFEIMCGDSITFEHFKKWIAYIIQKPSEKAGAIMPIFIGTEEGGGKGTLVAILTRMFGEKKVLETTAPSKHVFGNFNAQMEHAYLVYLNEMSKKEMLGVEEHLKSYITDKYIHINQKHVKTITIESNHKFICSTNNLAPKQSSDQSRRDWYIVIPNSLVGNAEYFNNIQKHLQEDSAVVSLFNYFRKYDFGDFASTAIPKGEYQRGLEQDSRKPIVLWTEQFLENALHNGSYEWGTEIDQLLLWDDYKKWIQKEYPTHTQMNRRVFTRNLTELVFKKVYPNYRNEIPPVFKRTNGKTRFVFYKEKMCNYFNISYCMLESH